MPVLSIGRGIGVITTASRVSMYEVQLNIQRAAHL